MDGTEEKTRRSYLPPALTSPTMPLGITRLNERTQRPNPLINFIKAPDQESLDYLNRIAAQCYPIMKQHHLSVMSLEEFPPNNEFLGRNFNAGEVIQLVLKDRQGRWLSFKFVQLVMMHELAHCKQMNHSKFFWQVRNGFAGDMEGLWAKEYFGEGMWGRGQDLVTGAFVREWELEDRDVPEHLCGGTFRRKGKKRKRGDQSGEADGKPKLTYAERQQKRIARKFGAHGEGAALGDDELLRGAYEQASGKRHAGKPRVANSKRGRELRAQAALARFGAAKSEQVKEEPEIKEEPGIKQEPEDSDYDSDWDDEITGNQSGNESDMVKVCGDEDENGDGAHHEMDELRKMSQKQHPSKQDGSVSSDSKHSDERKQAPPGRSDKQPTGGNADSETESEAEEQTESDQRASVQPLTDKLLISVDGVGHAETHQQRQEEPAGTCSICSLANDPSSPTCMACSNVLQPSLMPDHWRCKSDVCASGSYINAGDAGRCGICGAQKPKPSGAAGSASGNTGRGRGTTGVIEGDVLRWD